MDEEQTVAERHLFIAGTGRAGTSFLVRYLTEVGLDTHLRRHGAHAFWDEHANAGLEDWPLLRSDVTRPYVVKTPWLYQHIDAVLAEATLTLDAVIIPIRDLSEAASSRAILERRALYQNMPWMAEASCTAEEWGSVPGGVLYSLNPIDQGRLLAVGFHHLVQRLVEADVPMILLAFPRLATDPGYLLDKLRPVLPADLDRHAAIEAHRQVAAADKVRVGDELKPAPPAAPVEVMRYRSNDALDAIALRREVVRLRAEIAAAPATPGQNEQQALAHQAAHQALQQRLDAAVIARDEAAASTERTLRAGTDIAQALRAEVAVAEQEAAGLRQDLRCTMDRAAALQRELELLRRSRSWRLTGPYRAAGSRLHRLLHPA